MKLRVGAKGKAAKPAKKQYRPPKLRTFGSLWAMTQGSGGRRFDANYTRRRRTPMG